MCFWGPQTCPWLKIVANFFFLGGATELKIWDLAPRPLDMNIKVAAFTVSEKSINSSLHPHHKIISETIFT